MQISHEEQATDGSCNTDATTTKQEATYRGRFEQTQNRAQTDKYDVYRDKRYETSKNFNQNKGRVPQRIRPSSGFGGFRNPTPSNFRANQYQPVVRPESSWGPNMDCPPPFSLSSYRGPVRNPRPEVPGLRFNPRMGGPGPWDLFPPHGPPGRFNRPPVGQQRWQRPPY